MDVLPHYPWWSWNHRYPKWRGLSPLCLDLRENMSMKTLSHRYWLLHGLNPLSLDFRLLVFIGYLRALVSSARDPQEI